jgi:hypothetical protein
MMERNDREELEMETTIRWIRWALKLKWLQDTSRLSKLKELADEGDKKEFKKLCEKFKLKERECEHLWMFLTGQVGPAPSW